jgi:hypothetical protein
MIGSDMRLERIATRNIAPVEIEWFATLCSAVDTVSRTVSRDRLVELVTSELAELSEITSESETQLVGGLCCFLAADRVEIWIQDLLGPLSRENLIHEFAHALIGQTKTNLGHTLDWRRLYLLSYAHCLIRDTANIESARSATFCRAAGLREVRRRLIALQHPWVMGDPTGRPVATGRPPGQRSRRAQ